MIHYLIADFYRIFKRIPRYIVLLILFAGSVAIMMATADGRTPYQIVDLLTKYAFVICAVFAIVEYIYVYNDDFKAKSMQIAIGRGISRSGVILTKWLEVTILCVIDYLILVAIIIVCSKIKGASFSGEPASDVIIVMLTALMKVITAVGFTMIFTFFSQNSTLGMLLFILSITGIGEMIISALISVGFLDSLHLSSYLPNALIDTFKTRAIIGTFSIPFFLGVIAYNVAFFFAAKLIFKKRELDF